MARKRPKKPTVAETIAKNTAAIEREQAAMVRRVTDKMYNIPEDDPAFGVSPDLQGAARERAEWWDRQVEAETGRPADRIVLPPAEPGPSRWRRARSKLTAWRAKRAARRDFSTHAIRARRTTTKNWRTDRVQPVVATPAWWSNRSC